MMKKPFRAVSKVEQIQAHIRSQVADGAVRPGARLPSERALAAEFGVSLPTVNKAMSNLEADGLVRRSPGSGTFVSETPLTRRVAIISRHAFRQDPRHYFFRKALATMEQALADAGVECEVLLGHGDAPPEQDATRLLARISEGGRRGPFDGAVVQIEPYESNLVERIESLGIPTVGHVQEQNSYTVSHDQEAIVRKLAELLVDAGRRRIAILQPSRDERNGKSDWAFLPAFKQVLADAGLAFRHEWVCTAGDPFAPHTGWEQFHEIWNGRGEKPDGLVVGIDTIFPEAVMAILSEGIDVPGELMVVTHANKGSGQFAPFPVTRVQVDPERYGQTMVDQLLKRLRGESPPRQHLVLPFEVVAPQPHAGAISIGGAETAKNEHDPSHSE